MAVKKYYKRKTSTGWEVVYLCNDASCVAETSDRKFLTSAQKTKLDALPSADDVVKFSDLPEVEGFTAKQVLEDVVAKTHVHSKSDTDITNAVNNSHTHSNKSILDNVDQDLLNKKHTHSNKDTLDAITAAFTTALKDKLDALPTNATLQSTYATKSDIASVFRPKGSVNFASLPALSEVVVGSVYNIKDAFTTDSNFAEGRGKAYPAGTNVVCIEDSDTKLWDVLGGFVDLSGYALSSHNHDTAYAPKSHTHNNSDLTGLADWVKATTKPTYTYSEVGAAASSHNHYFDEIKTSSSDSTTLTSALAGKASSNHNHNGTYVRIWNQDTEPSGASIGDIWISSAA